MVDGRNRNLLMDVTDVSKSSSCRSRLNWPKKESSSSEYLRGVFPDKSCKDLIPMCPPRPVSSARSHQRRPQNSRDREALDEKPRVPPELLSSSAHPPSCRSPPFSHRHSTLPEPLLVSSDSSADIVSLPTPDGLSHPCVITPVINDTGVVFKITVWAARRFGLREDAHDGRGWSVPGIGLTGDCGLHGDLSLALSYLSVFLRRLWCCLLDICPRDLIDWRKKKKNIESGIVFRIWPLALVHKDLPRVPHSWRTFGTTRRLVRT